MTDRETYLNYFAAKWILNRRILARNYTGSRENIQNLLTAHSTLDILVDLKRIMPVEDRNYIEKRVKELDVFN